MSPKKKVITAVKNVKLMVSEVPAVNNNNNKKVHKI